MLQVSEDYLKQRVRELHAECMQNQLLHQTKPIKQRNFWKKLLNTLK